MISKYGSPNVLGEYDPHVTVGYDEDTSVSFRTERPTGSSISTPGMHGPDSLMWPLRKLALQVRSYKMDWWLRFDYCPKS
jgi:hypothetical protein